MCCNTEQVAHSLREELNFEDGAALAWARTCGRCEYCGRDLLTDRLAYAAGECDHVLPLNAYPQLHDELENRALSCSLCNSLKGDFNPLMAGNIDDSGDIDDLGEMITQHRDDLIHVCRDYIDGQRQLSDPGWELAKQIVLEIPHPLVCRP